MRLNLQKYKNISKNAAALFALQISNYIVPLLTLPYLSRVLGPQKYGLVIFAQVLVSYFLIINEYGFNYIGTRQISISRNDKSKIDQIFSSIMSTKLILLIISFLILLFITFSFDRFTVDVWIYIFSFGVVIGNFLFPVWYFQGIEKMVLITIINFMSKFLYIISLILIVKNEGDYIYVPILNSLAYIVSGVVALIIALNKFKIVLKLTAWHDIKIKLTEGWHVFFSNFSISLYAVTNTFFLGLVTDNTTIGYYGSSERIIQAIKFGFNPIFQAIFPSVSRNATSNAPEVKKKILQLGIVVAVISLALFLLVFLLSDYIIILILGSEYLAGKEVFKIMSILIFTTPITFLMFNILFLSFKLEHINSKIYFFSALINLVMVSLFLFVFKMGANGAAISNVITQSIILMAGIFVARTKVYKV